MLHPQTHPTMPSIHLRKKRSHYYAESLRRRFWQWPTLLFTVSGGLLALYLVGERLILAFGYIIEQLA